jgi:hypothetical protein
MSTNPFLSYGSDGDLLAALQSGTVPLNLASVVAQNVAAGSVLRSDADKVVVSGQVGLTDLNFTPVTSPYVGTFEATGLEATDLKVTNITGTAGAIDFKNTDFTATGAIEPNGDGVEDLGHPNHWFKDAYINGTLYGVTISGENLVAPDASVKAIGSLIEAKTSSSVSGNFPTYSGTTGELIEDSGKKPSDYAENAGATFTGAVSFSTLNPTAKSGLPMRLSRLTQYASVTCTDTITAASIVDGNSVGSLVYAANTTNAGMGIRFSIPFICTAFGGGGTGIFSFRVNTNTVVSLSVPAAFTGNGRAEGEVILGSGTTMYGSGQLLCSGAAVVCDVSSGISWNKTGSNTVELMFRWSVASPLNSMTVYGATVFHHYQT